MEWGMCLVRMHGMDQKDLNYTPRFTDALSQLELESVINAKEKPRDLAKRSAALDLLYSMAEGISDKEKRDRMLTFIHAKRKSIEHLPANTFAAEPIDFGCNRGGVLGEGAYRRGRNPGSSEIAYDGWGATYCNRE